MKTPEQKFIEAYKELKEFKKTFDVTKPPSQLEKWYQKQERLRKKKNKLFKKL